MNACEAEILSLTKYQPRKKYKNKDEYLICLLREIDALPMDKFEYLLSEQTFQWYQQAAYCFKNSSPMPPLPDTLIGDLRYSRDNEDYTPPEQPVATPEEHRDNINALIQAHEEADKALDKLQEASDKVKPKRTSKYRQAHPSEGARHYLFPEEDRFGLQKGTQRQVAAEMFERGATMKEVKEVTGYTVYNLLKKLRADGHTVTNSGGVIKVTHKSEVELKGKP